jgi:hypothetical protein
MVDASDIETLQRDGVVFLRRAFSDAWIARVRSGIDKDLAALGPLHTIQQPKDEPGYFVTDDRLASIGRILANWLLSPTGQIGACEVDGE